MTKFVLASHNPGKLKEMSAILEDLGVEVVLPSQVGVDAEVEETGETFEANALLKAKAVCQAAGLPAIADDSGLCVDALSGAPGVYTARYGGEGLTDAQRYTLLLNALRGQTNRAARFVSVVACAFPNGDTLTAEGRCDGTIAFAPMGTEGFGYDPVFFVPELRKTFAQMDGVEKASISVEPGLYNSFPTGFFSSAKIQRYVCRSCGYTEEWIAEDSMEKLRHSWDDSPEK